MDAKGLGKRKMQLRGGKRKKTLAESQRLMNLQKL
jgi:hypothetical protein